MRILILGDGMCGNATALSLQAAGHEVSLVGRGKPVSRSGIGEHLAPQALSSLHALGLERLLADPAHLRSPGIIGSWMGFEFSTAYAFSLGGDGFNLDRRVFDGQLRRAADDRGIRRLRGPLGEICRTSRGWRVHLPSAPDGTAEVDLLVDASGRSAALGRRLGARRSFLDDLIAVSGRFVGPEEGDARLIVESGTDGWWYCVRQTGARYVAVFLTGATDLAAAGSARKSSWRARLSTTKFGRALGDPLDPIIETWDARSMVLWPQAGPGWIAVGDAAMAFDALSAAGMTKALADATALARHLSTTDLEQDGFARLVEERRARWRNYIIGLQQTYASPSRENHPWWVGRRQWARRLGAADVQGVIDPGGEESEPEDSSAAPHR